jgi:hypothetical protein
VLTLLEPNGGKFTEDYTKIGGLYAKFEHTNLSDVSDLVVTWQDTYDWIALGPGSQGKNPYPDGTNPSIAWALFMVGSQNSSHCAREAKVDIYAEGSNTLTVTFLQKGASGSEQTPANGCDINASLAVSPTELTGVTDAGDNTTITVTANVTWDATVTTGAFITISDETGNTGTSGGSFKITVAKNETSYPRNGVVTVTGTGGIVRTIAVTQVASSATPAVPGESVLHGGVYWATHNVKVKGVSFTDNAGDLGYNFVDAERWDAPEVVATYCPAGWHVPSRAEYQAAKAGGVELDNSDFNSATQVTLNDGAGSTALILPFWTTGPEGYNRGGVYIGDKQDDFMGLGFFGWTQNGELYNISNNGSQAWQRYLRCIRN